MKTSTIRLNASVLRRNPNVDIVRVQDVGLSEADDPTVLQWAAQNNRVVLTHDPRNSLPHQDLLATADGWN